MKKIKNIIIALGALLTTLSSCDYLDRDPVDVIGKDEFFKTATGDALEQYCNFFYPKLIIGHGAPNTYNFGMLDADFKGDYLLEWDYNTTSFGHQTPPTDKSGTPWDWEVVRACNDFLVNYNLSPETEVIKQRYAGEILFFKSMDYFNKVKAYGDVPWYDTPLNPGDKELYKPRDSREVVMSNVLRDINQAIEWLPKKTQVSRVSKDAALALKARMCLYEGTFRKYHNIEGDTKFLEEAYNAAGELMKPEYGYSLYKGSSPSKSYYELFIQADYNNNSEVILSREYNPAKGKGHNLTRQIVVGERPIGMSKKAVDNYLCANTGLPTSQCSCHSTHSTLINELKNRDPRLLQTVPTPEAGPFTYYLDGKRPAIGKVIAGNQGASSTGYSIIKFYNPDEYGASHHQGTFDAPIMRFGEILLIRAEAGAELGKNPELDLTINVLRERVGFNHKLTSSPVVDNRLEKEYKNVKGSNATLIREIRRERSIELFGEGYRYDDLLRWKEGHNLTDLRVGIIPTLATSATDQTAYTQEEINKLKTDLGFDANGAIDVYGKRVQRAPIFNEAKHYLQAIPLEEISLNPELKQNPNW